MNNDILHELRKLNFEELIHIDTDDAANYTYETYRANGGHKIKADGVGGCCKCEDRGCIKNPSHKLRFVSHGAHTDDFLSNHPIDLTSWSNAPILFLLESPGGDGKFYAEEKELRKRPTTQWYWVHGGTTDLDDLVLEKYVRLKKYGEFFASVINHFKLSNVYVTNLVKCGLEIDGNPEYNIQSYDKYVVENCLKEYLSRELDIVKPQAVFAFSGRVYNEFRKKYSKSYPENEKLFCMPHPGARRISQTKYRQTALNHLLIGLYKSGIITLTQKDNYIDYPKNLKLL